MEFIQSKIMMQQRAGNMLHTTLHLLLEMKPNRYLVKAEIVVSAIDNVVESITYEIDPNVYKELRFARGVDGLGKNRKAFDEFILNTIRQMVEEH